MQQLQILRGSPKKHMTRNTGERANAQSNYILYCVTSGERASTLGGFEPNDDVRPRASANYVCSTCWCLGGDGEGDPHILPPLVGPIYTPIVTSIFAPPLPLEQQ